MSGELYECACRPQPRQSLWCHSRPPARLLHVPDHRPRASERLPDLRLVCNV